MRISTKKLLMGCRRVAVLLCPSSFVDCILACTESAYPVCGSAGTPITGTDGVYTVSYYSDTTYSFSTLLTVTGTTSGKSFSCFVDADHLYFYNYTTSKKEKYLKSNLSLVDSISDSPFQGGCTDSSNIAWIESAASIKKYTKSPFALDHTYSAIDLGEYAPYPMVDLAVDDEYIYVAESTKNSIQRRWKQCLCLDQQVGDKWIWGTDATGIAVSGNYVYIATFYNIVKANKNTWQIEELLGDGYSKDYTLGRPESNMFPYDVMTYNGDLYVLGYYGIARWSENNITVCGNPLIVTGGAWDAAGSLNDPWQMCTDGTYLYTCDWNGMVIKYDLSTGTYIAEYGDRTYTYDDAPYGFSLPFGIATDGTHVYVIDQNSNFRVVKLLASNMSYVTEYRSDTGWEDIGGHQWSNPQSLMYHAGYLYVSDPNYVSSISRINSGTMLYVDTTIVDFDPADPGSYGYGEIEAMVIDGSYMYIANYYFNPCAAKLTFPGLALVNTPPALTNLPNAEIMGLVTGITVGENYVYVTCNIERASNPLVGANEIRIYNKLTFDFVDSFAVIDGKPKSPAVDGTYIYFTIQNSGFLGDQTDYVKKCLKASPYTEIESYSSVGAGFASCDVAWLYQLNQS